MTTDNVDPPDDHIFQDDRIVSPESTQSVPEFQNWINTLENLQPKLPEPENFRENVLGFMKAWGSHPAATSDFEPAIEAKMRRATDYLADRLFARRAEPDVLKQEIQLQPDEEIFLQMYFDVAAMLGLLIIRTADLPPSRGYEPLLMENGCNQIAARGIAHIAVHSGRRQARESKSHRPVVDAIRFLAVPGRRKRAIASRARVLLDACEKTSIIETIFSNAGLFEGEFISLLKRAAKGEKVDHRRLTEIAAEIAPGLELPRGPKVSAPSATHNFILENAANLTMQRRPQAWRNSSKEYCDPLTEATRREFNTPAFDSRPARRRFNARRVKKAT